MPDINDEMKAIADFAVRSAKERYKLDLDYSEQSLASLQIILEKIYWGFSGHSSDTGKSGLIYNTAIVWGSYLGEFMRLKWGGKWFFKGTDRFLLVNQKELSPVDWIFKRITTNPEYRLEDYLDEVKRFVVATIFKPATLQSRPIPPAAASPRIIPTPQPAPAVQPAPMALNAPVSRPRAFEEFAPATQVRPKEAIQTAQKVDRKSAARKFLFNRHFLIPFGATIGVLLLVGVGFAGYSMINQGGLPDFGDMDNVATVNTDIPQPVFVASAKPTLTDTPQPTITLLPTYTPRPTRTPKPSGTPTITPTETSTVTPTETETLYPTWTRTVKKSPTPTEEPTEPYTPTKTATQVIIITRTPTPTNVPQPTKTPTPEPSDTPVPTATEVPPPQIDSCSVSPSTIDVGHNVTLTFTVKFSAGGQSFSISDNNFDPGFPGHSGCNASDPDGDGTASCDGSSGLLPGSTTVNVSINSSAGDCSVSYKTP